MKRLGTLLSAFLMVSATAQAADLGWNAGASPIYSPTPVSGWSGFYAGINADYGWGGVTRRATIGGAATDNNTGGGVFGAQAGYNLDMGGFVLGTEADLQWSGIGYSEDVAGVGTFKAGVDYFGTVRGRAGMSFGQVMPYVTGGFAAGRGSATITDGAVTVSESANHFGWTAGVGLEAQATTNLSFKAEYLYVDLGSQSYNNIGLGNLDVNQRFSVVRTGVSYKF